MNLDLDKRYALVGGGSKGLGLASAKELALLGASVILTGRNVQSLETALAQLDIGRGQQHRLLVLDSSELEETEEKLYNLCKELTISILVNNTGGPRPGKVEEQTITDIDQAVQRMLLSFHLHIKAVLPGMKQQGFGRIINITSTSSREPILELGLSNMVRAAVAAMGKSLSKELGQFGITVNNVLPGSHDTERIQELIEKKVQNSGLSKDQVVQEMTSIIPAGRFGKPDEFGAVVAFLSSPAAAYVNGVDLPVDGGRLNSL